MGPTVGRGGASWRTAPPTGLRGAGCRGGSAVPVSGAQGPWRGPAAVGSLAIGGGPHDDQRDRIGGPAADREIPGRTRASAVERSGPGPPPKVDGATVGDWLAQSLAGPVAIEGPSPPWTRGELAGPSVDPLEVIGRSARSFVATIEPQIGAGCRSGRVATSRAEGSHPEIGPDWLRSCRSSRNSTTSEILFFRARSGPMKKLRQWP